MPVPHSLNRQIIVNSLSREALAYLFPGYVPDVIVSDRHPEVRMRRKAVMFDMMVQKEEIRQNPDSLDSKTEALLKEIERIQKEYGVSIEDLEILLGYRVTLSRLQITQIGKLYLTEFNNVEVKMDNVSKALYILYLKHPEGIPFKEVGDHREELLSIYRSICGRDNPEEIEKSIDHLVNPLGNALNVAASRIKIAFRNVVSDRVAKFYYINGSAREAKKVPLDCDLVIWI